MPVSVNDVLTSSTSTLQGRQKSPLQKLSTRRSSGRTVGTQKREKYPHGSDELGEGGQREREGEKKSAWKETKNVFSGTSEGNMLLQWIRGRQIGIEKLIKMLIFNHFLFAFDFG